MFKDLMNEEVIVIVSSRSEVLFEYHGTLTSEDDGFIKLNNVLVKQVMSNFQKNVFGGNIATYDDNIKTTIINKKFVISCNKK